jgi:hypothetical protein
MGARQAATFAGRGLELLPPSYVRGIIMATCIVPSTIVLSLLFFCQVGLSSDAALLHKLRDAPLKNAAAARWYASLPLEKKRAYAAQLGRIVLESQSGNFVVAIGSDQSPYPWAFIVTKDKVTLYKDNTFSYVLRNDEDVKNQWGAQWATTEKYELQTSGGSVKFRNTTPPKGFLGALWIPVSGWRYVGPSLTNTSRTPVK